VRGTNAALVGILGAALGRVQSRRCQIALGLSGFLLLTVWTLPPWIVFALLAAAGLLFGLV
jgi:chromate transporter